ncbi:MAG: sporulation protein [Lachnospiraceae bacterium]|nr:sporulation protein [Lachnospiraceae bacterium]
MAESKFNETVASMFKGMDHFITTKTVVGDAIRIDAETVILPLVDVSFGVGAGAFENNAKNNAGGGLGGKVQPSAVLVFQNGNVRLVNIKNQDIITKVFDMIPGVINRFGKKEAPLNEDEIVKEAFQDESTGPESV